MNKILKSILAIVSICLSMIFITTIQAATRTWDGDAADGDWFNPLNWDGDTTYPSAGDDVVITSTGGGVTLTNPTEWLSSFSITNNTLTFADTTNLTTVLQSTNVYIRDLGILTHVSNTATQEPWFADARVYVQCADLTIDPGGKIDVSEKGYMKNSQSQNGYGFGPGGGMSAGSTYRPGGGGYGGRGGDGVTIKLGGEIYGSLLAPVDPGSAGGSAGGSPPYNAGNGGGVVRIAASGKVQVDGSIIADGETPSGNGGGGSGGSIYITCDTFATTDGVIRANGGNPARQDRQGEGGGGRIAIVYNSVVSTPDVNFSLNPGTVTYTANRRADSGTLYLSDNSFYPTDTIFSGLQLYIPGFTSWSLDSLTVSTANFTLLNAITLSITNDFLLTDGSKFSMSECTLSVGGNVTVENDSSLHIASGPTNGVGPAYGALLEVGQTLMINDTSVLYLYSDNTNGGSVLVTAADCSVATNAAINADYAGFKAGADDHPNGYGPGGGIYHSDYRGSGGGYGGRGGRSTAGTSVGPAYGSSNAPALPGSGGSTSLVGNADGEGDGGGLIRMVIDGSLHVDGTLSANGKSANSSGGSGGGIFLQCDNFSGAGTLQADGGDGRSGQTGAGGGGRIAVWYGVPDSEVSRIIVGDLKYVVISSSIESFSGTTSVTNGLVGYDSGDPTEFAQPGTVVFLTVDMPPQGTFLIIK